MAHLVMSIMEKIRCYLREYLSLLLGKWLEFAVPLQFLVKVCGNLLVCTQLGKSAARNCDCVSFHFDCCWDIDTNRRYVFRTNSYTKRAPFNSTLFIDPHSSIFSTEYKISSYLICAAAFYNPTTTN